MQSQQKRVKWSRGETAEALEERTDTGITQASVEYMENCIPDIYGNISRRPALKPIPFADNYSAQDTSKSKSMGFKDSCGYIIPFYYTENDFCLIGINYDDAPEVLRIVNGEIVKKERVIGTYPVVDESAQMSYAQQNNYLLVANNTSVYKIQIADVDGTNFTAVSEIWQFSAGWYAPEGTKTKKVTNTDVPNMSFRSNTVESYSWTESDGSTSVGSWISTGVVAANYSGVWTGATTTFYCGFTNTNPRQFVVTTDSTELSSYHMTWTMTNGTTYTSGQQVANYSSSGIGSYVNEEVRLYLNGNNAYFVGTANGSSIGVQYSYTTESYDVSPDMTNNIPLIQQLIPNGSIVQFANNGAYMRVEGYTSDSTHLRMYGELLTPVADNNATDTSVNVEYGYVSLAPLAWGNVDANYPHPTKLVFNQQRLWAGGWAFNATDQYALVIGSQIARYNDLKNNYNLENEPITLDILTQFKERILHLVDYNGLKIMTDAYEYSYESGGLVKQSGNGSWANCKPLVFDSLCLYVDSTGKQIKAMQYEFQSNIFNSTTINQLTPHDLVWNPYAMASYEDKTHSTGKYLFVLNEDTGDNDTLAVCNFVPSNQANIWSRWTFPRMPGYNHFSRLGDIVHTKTMPIFIIKIDQTWTFDTGDNRTEYPSESFWIPAILDFDGVCDYELDVVNNQVIAYQYDIAGSSDNSTVKAVLRNVEVDVYADGEFKFSTTTDNKGYITDDLTGLTNVKAGFRINSKIISHPIDVGGKTKSIKKRIAKARMSVHDTDAGAITINDKTGYMNPAKDYIQFYGVTGMKQEIKYTITNKQGAMFHLESLLMNIEYGTLIS